MANDRTQLVFIIDRSGSMSGLEQDTIGGFNSVLKQNRELPGECLVTTVLFSTESHVLHDALPVAQVPEMTARDYVPMGGTALLDAMGHAIDRVLWQENPGRVQFIIITDGEENSSHEYSLPRIREMVTGLTAQRHWDFMFLGANMDAISAAGRMGIMPQRAVTACADGQGLKAQYKSMAAANMAFRRSDEVACPLSEDWKAPVQQDMASRRRK